MSVVESASKTSGNWPAGVRAGSHQRVGAEQATQAIIDFLYHDDRIRTHRLLTETRRKPCGTKTYFGHSAVGYADARNHLGAIKNW